MIGRALRSLLVAVALGIGAIAPAHAQLWYESYARAEQAVQAGNWDEAVRQLNLAIEKKGDSGARVRTYGMNFTAYFPYLKLGLAYYNLEQYEAAQQALDTEERLGAVGQSPSDLAELQRLRRSIADARTVAAEGEKQRIERIVAESLDEARRLEAAGDLDAALEAAGKAVAVAQDDPRATDAVAALRSKVAEAQTRVDRERRAAHLVAQGRTLLGARRWDEAAAQFQQAIALEPSDEARSLLAQAQAGLRTELAEQDAAGRRRTVAEAIAEAHRLRRESRLGEALGRLETALALDPTNREARDLHEQVLAAQARSDGEKSRQATIDGLLTQARTTFETGDFDGALGAANQVLALDRENAQAMDYVGRAYRALSQTLLGKVRLDLPPTIGWLDLQAYKLADGAMAEQVREPTYKFSGTVYDEATVEIRVLLEHYGRPGAERGSKRSEQALEVKRSVEQRGQEYLSHFAVERSLRPGLSVFAVEVEDPLGKDTRREYAVLYSPPFHRTLAFRSALGALVLAIPAGVYGARVHRRRSLLKRRFNPYVAGAPILRDELFFGRERLLSQVLQRVHTNCILLYGERRIGKTSFQHLLKRRLAQMDDPQYRFYPVFIDLQGTPQERFFATLGQEVFHELAPQLNGVGPGPGLAAPDSYDYRTLVDDLRRVLRKLEEQRDKRVKLVLLIDEVDELNDYDPRVNQRLRSLFMREFAESLVAVVSGVGIKKRWESEGSPWYNFFEEIEVKPFPREDAARLITRPIRGVFRLEPGVTDRIIDLAECRPYLIQKLCAALVNRLHEQGRRTITLADVEALGRVAEA